MIQCVRLWGPRGLTNSLLPAGGTFDIPELLNGVLVLTIHVSGAQGCSTVVLGALVDLPLGDAAHSGGVQLSQGAAVLEVAGSMLVKAFLVRVEAHQEKDFLEDLVL